MSPFTERQRTLDTYWRSIILFGQNVASYKFALAQSLIDLSETPSAAVSLEQLAVPFSRHLSDHSKAAPKQTTSRSGRYLDTCRRYNDGQLTGADLVAATVKLGFNNVIDAFHVVNRDVVPVRFFVDERSSGGGIRITDELYRLREQLQFANLPNEVEARWRLVETAWALDLPSSLIVACDPEQDSVTTILRNRRISVTRCRDALNGYQKGKCFYCFADVKITGAEPDSADVDHFFPHVLGRLGLQYPWNGVWNLVLACRSCNRGVDGKSSRLPELAYLERLHARNEFLIGSHHPLRETLMAQTGGNVRQRIAFLNAVLMDARGSLIHTWKPAHEYERAF